MNEKLKNINKLVTKNVNLSKEIESLTITDKNVIDTKKIVKINLINEEHIDDSIITLYKFEFDLFPEWAVSMSKIKPIFAAPNGYEFDNIWMDTFFRYRWTKNSDTKMTLEIKLYVAGYDVEFSEPIAITTVVDLIIYNEKKFS